jgi:PTS system ascorbate-specific IIC component
LLPVLGDLGYANTTFSDADFIGVGIIIGWVATFDMAWLITVLIVVLFALPFVHAVLTKNKAEKPA